jgi:nucleoside-diphosphate-sugar epimerase
VDLYGVSKRTAEQLVAVKAARAGIPYLIARIFNVVGPGQTALHVCGRFARGLLELEGETRAVLEVGPLAPTRDFVDVRDLSDGLMLLARRGMPGETYNLASGRETAVGEILRELVRLSGIEAAVVERGDRPAGVSRHVADISKARRLGYAVCHPLSQSLRDLLRFQRSVRATGAPPIVPSV